MSDQGNRTSELDADKAIDQWIDGLVYCRDEIRHDIARSAKIGLKKLISQEAARLTAEAIGDDQKYTDDPVLDLEATISNKLRAEQRRRLDALQGGTKG